MNKREFYIRAVPLLKEEPSRDQWECMFEIHCRDQRISVAEIIDRVMNSTGIIDRRRIPQEFRGEIVSLEALAVFGLEMAEKFKKGSLDARNDNKKRTRNRMG